MSTLLVAVLSFFGFIIAYYTYGRWLGRRIFELDDQRLVPSKELRDDVDYVPAKKQVIFGHHFTSIAGTGPIVGPAIAVFWGWLPALIWVLVGSIFIGAVHDFGALVVSMRNRGQTVGQIAGRMISPRTKVLFLLILFFALTIVLAIFGLVIAVIFKLYPSSVLPVWISLPIAIVAGMLVYRRGANMLVVSLVALAIIYFCIWLGAYHLPISIPPSWTMFGANTAVIIWTVILLIYCFFASVLPVWLLLQPRDYVNSHQLILALVLLVAGLFVASISGSADLFASAPAVASPEQLPAGAPPIWPFLFITIACGAVSGFHCLVSSGTSSKQIATESDARFVGYGAMLLEGALAVIVILACCAGIGMGVKSAAVAVADAGATGQATAGTLTGRTAWFATYDSTKSWAEFNLGKKVGAFIDGGANFLSAIGVPLQLGVGMIAVLVACFAATTLDTATRLQRYVVQELAGTLRIAPLENKYLATGFAVLCGAAIAFIPGPTGAGSGGMILWPLFGATNQLLAGLAFLVIAFYLWRRGKPMWFVVIPMVVMIVLPGWALLWQMFNAETGWWQNGNYLLFGFGITIMALQIWMVIEAILAWPQVRGVLEEALPPLNKSGTLSGPQTVGGRSC